MRRDVLCIAVNGATIGLCIATDYVLVAVVATVLLLVCVARVLAALEAR